MPYEKMLAVRWQKTALDLGLRPNLISKLREQLLSAYRGRKFHNFEYLAKGFHSIDNFLSKLPCSEVIDHAFWFHRLGSTEEETLERVQHFLSAVGYREDQKLQVLQLVSSTFNDDLDPATREAKVIRDLRFAHLALDNASELEQNYTSECGDRRETLLRATQKMFFFSTHEFQNSVYEDAAQRFVRSLGT